MIRFRITFLIFILSYPVISLLCKNIAKVYSTKSIFGKIQTKTAFRNVTIDLPSGLLCIVGTSGSGKSTLVKCVSRLVEVSFGSLLSSKSALLMDTISSCVCTAYLGLQFREVYDKSKLVSNLIVPLFILSSLVHPSFIRILELAYTTMEIESILESQVSGLLESQRAAFNVYTGIQSALLSQSAVSKENRDMLDRWGGLTVRKVLTPSELPLESPAYLTVYLVLDEYLDKMASSVRLSLLSKLNKLIYAIKSANGVPDLLSVDESVRVNNNPTSYSTEFTVLVVTHSARVLRDCNSRSAVMNNGRLYDLQDSYQKLNMPAQLQLLD